MSRSIHFISNTIPGYGPDGSRLPCPEISRKALCLSPRSCREHKLASDVKFLSLRCVTRYTSTVCNASSSNYRRNPDFSKQNRQGYSRHGNRHNDMREEYEDVEESETLSSKNGPLVSGHKYQPTVTTGPREKEIVELFRKVQTQLRGRAAMKEGKKIEESEAKSKESETVDSLLKLLRKHSVQQGKKSNTSTNSRDFILDHDEQVDPLIEERSTIISDTTSSVKHETTQENPSPLLSRPKSNFRKRSPVPEIKFRPVYSEDSGISISEVNVDSEGKWSSMEPEAHDVIQDLEYDSESDASPLTLEVDDAFDEVLEDKMPEIVEIELEDIAKEDDLIQVSDLHEMKMTELRSLAKSRGMKGFSKLKKSDLIEMLSSGSI